MSVLRRDAGMTTLEWPAATALRSRVSMSAIGSVIMVICSGLPARLHDAGNLPPQRALAEADAAHGKTAHERPRSPAQPTPIVLLHGELRRALCLGNHGFFGHRVLPFILGGALEGHAHQLQQP